MAKTKYIWDPVNDSYLMETDGSDTTTAVYTNEPTQFGSLVSQRRGSTTSTYHYDALGSTRELTDAAETITDTNVYDAWGIVISSTGSTTNPFQWIGQLGYYWDSEELGTYVRQRQYGSVLARWLAYDPVFDNGASIYIYADNSPVVVNDPTGLYGIFDKIGEIGGALIHACGYGHFCGPSRRAKCTGVDKPSKSNPQPRDGFDRACMEHDCCLMGVLQVVNPVRYTICNTIFCAKLNNPFICKGARTPSNCEFWRRAAAVTFCVGQPIYIPLI